jgi:hypothetical protein
MIAQNSQERALGDAVFYVVAAITAFGPSRNPRSPAVAAAVWGMLSRIGLPCGPGLWWWSRPESGGSFPPHEYVIMSFITCPSSRHFTEHLSLRREVDPKNAFEIGSWSLFFFSDAVDRDHMNALQTPPHKRHILVHRRLSFQL